MIWLLLVIYQIKHFVADYLLQGKYMLGKFKKYPEFVLPLLAHVAVHGAMTFSITIFFKSLGFSFGLALFDMTMHFIVDRIKASPEMLGRFKPLSPNEFRSVAEGANYNGNNGELLNAKKFYQRALDSNKYFWWSLGLDQKAHHLTHYLIIYMILLP